MPQWLENYVLLSPSQELIQLHMSPTWIEDHFSIKLPNLRTFYRSGRNSLLHKILYSKASPCTCSCSQTFASKDLVVWVLIQGILSFSSGLPIYLDIKHSGFRTPDILTGSLQSSLPKQLLRTGNLTRKSCMPFLCHFFQQWLVCTVHISCRSSLKFGQNVPWASFLVYF